MIAGINRNVCLECGYKGKLSAKSGSFMLYIPKNIKTAMNYKDNMIVKFDIQGDNLIISRCE